MLNWNVFLFDVVVSDVGDVGDGEEGVNVDVRGSVRTEDETSFTADSFEFVDVDVVFGVDLVYDDVGVVVFLCVVKVLFLCVWLGVVFYYVYIKYRYDGMDLDFFANVSANGLTCEEVCLCGVLSLLLSLLLFELLFFD